MGGRLRARQVCRGFYDAGGSAISDGRRKKGPSLKRGDEAKSSRRKLKFEAKRSRRRKRRPKEGIEEEGLRNEAQRACAVSVPLGVASAFTRWIRVKSSDGRRGGEGAPRWRL